MQIRHIRNTRNRKKWTIMHFTNPTNPEKMKDDTMVSITDKNKKQIRSIARELKRLVP